jgi:hypothetical protein
MLRSTYLAFATAIVIIAASAAHAQSPDDDFWMQSTS